MGKTFERRLGERYKVHPLTEVVYRTGCYGRKTGAGYFDYSGEEPLHKHVDQILSDFTFGKQHFEDVMAENLFKVLELKGGRYPEHTISIETFVRTQHMQMRIESEEVSERLYGNNRPWHCILFRYGFLKKDLQRVPSTATEIGKEFSIIEEISAEDFGYAEDEMPVRNGLEDFFAEPFPEFHHPFLAAGGAKTPSFTRKSQQIFMATVLTPHTCKAVVEDATVKSMFKLFLCNKINTSNLTL